MSDDPQPITPIAEDFAAIRRAMEALRPPPAPPPQPDFTTCMAATPRIPEWAAALTGAGWVCDSCRNRVATAKMSCACGSMHFTARV